MVAAADAKSRFFQDPSPRLKSTRDSHVVAVPIVDQVYALRVDRNNGEEADGLVTLAAVDTTCMVGLPTPK